jgi:glycosyltransferase involved in cell wall biosynthesis
MNKILCSVEVLTHNSASTLSKTLESLVDFDQVIILDGNSSDDTRKIANDFGCQIIEQDSQFQKKRNSIGDFAGIRNQGLMQAKHKWFLFVDSDEIVTKSLANEIFEIINSGTEAAAYWVPRKYVLNGEVIERACTYPNRQMRFFGIDGAFSFVKKVHERIQLKPGTEVCYLKNEILVPVDIDRVARMRKMRYYIQIEFERHSEMTPKQYLTFVFHHVGVSGLYLVRTIRNMFVGSGKRLPFSFELDYHIYHILLCKKFIEKIRI